MSTNNWIFGPICGLLLTATQSAAQSFTYVSIDVPCSAFPSGAACPARVSGSKPNRHKTVFSSRMVGKTELIHFSRSWRPLATSLFRQLAGGDFDVAVWRLPACGRDQ